MVDSRRLDREQSSAGFLSSSPSQELHVQERG